ncbi:MAG: SMR family transporter [Candidatus Wildermuthbacteria bacterium]|nr:SMR family transporter [Candidatus Wildermuthbacteria bacterium]
MFQSFILLGVSIVITVTAQLLIKKGVLALGNLNFSVSNLAALIPRVIQNLWLLAGLFLFGVSFLLWIFIISKLKLNIAYPISTSLSFCLITLSSWFLFKEQLSWMQFSGIAAIIIGIFLVAKS